MAYDKALSALADPTRRKIVEALAAKPQAVSALASEFPISRPAISQHLKVLSDAGLIDVTPVGNRRIYRLAPDGITELRAYLNDLWDDALQAFAAEATRLSKEKT